MKIEIKARITGAVLFTADIADDTEPKFQIRAALEVAVKARANLAGANLARANLAGAYLAGAYLTGAYLTGAYLTGANLAGANLARANLARANLAGANLTGANLAGANLARANLARAYLARANLTGANYEILPATKDEAVANLDKVREIVLDNENRLQMDHWHGDNGWQERTCAEETVCGTTHCMAGWLQVCSTNEKVRALLNVELAGTLSAPIARSMFYADQDEALEWLRDRKYAA